jgi:hypothetical protein
LRKEEETKGSLCVIYILQSNWVKEERIEWNQDQEVRKIIQQLHEDPNLVRNFVWNNELIWYHDHLYLCKNSLLKQNIFLELYTTPIRGHPGFFKINCMIK